MKRLLLDLFLKPPEKSAEFLVYSCSFDILKKINALNGTMMYFLTPCILILCGGIPIKIH
jgi:hypothetical protein